MYERVYVKSVASYGKSVRKSVQARLSPCFYGLCFYCLKDGRVFMHVFLSAADDRRSYGDARVVALNSRMRGAHLNRG